MIKSINITQKIWLSISVLVLGYFASMAVGFYLGGQTEKRLYGVSEVLLPAVKQSQLALSSFKEEFRMYYDAVISAEESFIESADNKSIEVIAALNIIVNLKGITQERIKETKRIIQRVKVFNNSAKNVYSVIINQFNENYDKNEEKESSNSNEFLDDQVLRLGKDARLLQKILKDFADNFSSDLKYELFSISKRTKQQRYTNLIVFIFVVIIALSLIFVIVSQSISRPLKKTFMLESVVKQSIDGIAVSDMDMKLEFINRSWADMHGYKVEEMMGKEMKIFYTKEQLRGNIKPFLSEVNKIGVKAAEVGHVRKNGETFPAMMTMSLLKDSNGKPINYVYIARDITIQKKNEAELKTARKELIEKAHKAGMADIATGTLHNVGNILNSVKTSTQAIADTMEKSPLNGLNKANKMLRDNIDYLEEFFTNNPKSKKLMQYYLKLEDGFNKEKDSMKQHLERLFDKVDIIDSVVSAQQSYAGSTGFEEETAFSEIIEDAITMQSGSVKQYNIAITKDLKDIPIVPVQKTKLVHILINLIQNAKDAMLSIPPEDRKLKIKTESNNEAVFIKVIDSGSGIDKEHIEKIFSHGFTTKKTGHGFGLHSSANYMTEMGGKMWVESEGKGKGSTFVLRFSL